MSVLPPFQAPQRADEAVVRIPPLGLTPVNTGLLLAAASVLFDQATKELAARTLIPNRQVDLLPDAVPFFGDGWGWQLIFNPGGALGFYVRHRLRQRAPPSAHGLLRLPIGLPSGPAATERASAGAPATRISHLRRARRRNPLADAEPALWPAGCRRHLEPYLQ